MKNNVSELLFIVIPIMLLALLFVPFYIYVSNNEEDISGYFVLVCALLLYPVCLYGHKLGWYIWLRIASKLHSPEKAWELYLSHLDGIATGGTLDNAVNMGVKVLGERPNT